MMNHQKANILYVKRITSVVLICFALRVEEHFEIGAQTAKLEQIYAGLRR